MRRSSIVVGMVALVMSASCKSETKAEAEGQAAVEAKGEAEGKAEAKAEANVQASLQPQIGGQIVLVGEHAVELVAFADGRVYALLMDAKGNVVADPAEVKLAATFDAKGGAKAKVDLKWDAPTARFVGKADAGVELAAGPVEVSLDLDGKAQLGTLAKLALAVDAEHGGQVVLVGDYAVELVADGGFVNAFVFDASGKAHAKGDLDLALEVAGGKKLALTWDAPSASYKAKLDAGLDLTAKPIVVSIAAGGKVATGAVAKFNADARAAFNAKAALAANAKLGADVNVKAPDVSAQMKAAKTAAAEAKASIKAPSVNLNVNKTASAGASTKAGASAGATTSGSTGASAGTKAGAKGGFSIGTK